jgi:hypothetical protein
VKITVEEITAGFQEALDAVVARHTKVAGGTVECPNCNARFAITDRADVLELVRAARAVRKTAVIRGHSYVDVVGLDESLEAMERALKPFEAIP